MPLVPAAPPQPVPMLSGFDYVTVDSVHRRVYAAHSGSKALLIVDADSGAVIGQVRVGALHGIAVDPANGHVYTADSEGREAQEVDPVALKVLRTVPIDGVADAIAYDPANRHIYIDEDDGNRIFVIDSQSFKSVGTVNLPGHKPEYLAVDPQTHDVYQNIATDSEFVVVDPRTLTVRSTVKTPEITNNHPLQYDPGLKQVLVGGSNGVLAVYSPNGHKLWQVDVPKGIDQCDLDAVAHRLACAGSGEIALLALSGNAPPRLAGEVQVARGMHTLAIDAKTHDVWAVWASPQGDRIERFTFHP